ncbi:MAG: hypothetical protein M3Y06_07340 [Actinomycetota bacterium]|nr:hypothetical protein [Actinomycetota bacterium]
MSAADADGDARDDDTGARLRRSGRDEYTYEHAGRTWPIYVEADAHGMTVYIARTPVWTDGTRVPDNEIVAARGMFGAVGEALSRPVTVIDPARDGGGSHMIAADGGTAP